MLACKYCGEIDNFTERNGGADVMAAYCNGCGHVITIQPKPIVYMPFGEHMGKRLDDMASNKDHRKYLQYIVDYEKLDPRLRPAIHEVL
jgi:hypothetical protein